MGARPKHRDRLRIRDPALFAERVSSVPTPRGGRIRCAGIVESLTKPIQIIQSERRRIGKRHVWRVSHDKSNDEAQADPQAAVLIPKHLVHPFGAAENAQTTVPVIPVLWIP